MRPKEQQNLNQKEKPRRIWKTAGEVFVTTGIRIKLRCVCVRLMEKVNINYCREEWCLVRSRSRNCCED